jgi:hypothetical protein
MSDMREGYGARRRVRRRSAYDLRASSTAPPRCSDGLRGGKGRMAAWRSAAGGERLACCWPRPGWPALAARLGREEPAPAPSLVMGRDEGCRSHVVLPGGQAAPRRMAWAARGLPAFSIVPSRGPDGLRGGKSRRLPGVLLAMRPWVAYRVCCRAGPGYTLPVAQPGRGRDECRRGACRPGRGRRR